MRTFRYYLKSAAGISAFLLILFVSAGRVDYPHGWLFAAVSLAGLLLNILLSGGDAELLEERGERMKDAQPWDLQLMKLSGLATLTAYILAGLDSGRFHPSIIEMDLPLASGMALTVGGQLLFALAKRENRFFSSVARIQSDRGHTVCMSGPYRIVRHPGYTGMILSWLGFPLLLASVWCIVPVLIAMLLLLIRTQKEDAMLQFELAGYPAYADRIRYRLVPGLW